MRNKEYEKSLKIARKELLILANTYEVKKRKYLRNVFYDAANNRFRWIGKAHDYSYYL